MSKNLEQVDGNLWRAKGQIIDNKKMKHKTAVRVTERSLEEKNVPESNFRQRFVTSGKHVR
ncbi:MAG: hypothetical protein F3745_09630 [Nitrospinae bacterium]|nr:hypothetical protein [Nitrospinota bacterium]